MTFQATEEETIKQRAIFHEVAEERAIAQRMRHAIGFCKQELQIGATIDHALKYEERVNFERCLTKNFLLKHGMDYFGKRDIIFVDLMAPKDVRKVTVHDYNSWKIN